MLVVFIVLYHHISFSDSICHCRVCINIKHAIFHHLSIESPTNVYQYYCRFDYFAQIEKTWKVHGALLSIHVNCNVCKKKTPWRNLNFLGRYPSIHVEMSAAILLSGVVVKKAFRIFEMLNIAMHSYKTFFAHQAKLLNQAVKGVWKQSQEDLFKSLKEKGVCI